VFALRHHVRLALSDLPHADKSKSPVWISPDQSAMVAGFLMIGNTVGTPFSVDQTTQRQIRNRHWGLLDDDRVDTDVGGQRHLLPPGESLSDRRRQRLRPGSAQVLHLRDLPRLAGDAPHQTDQPVRLRRRDGGIRLRPVCGFQTV
jgi:hypothetical protein